ncbi:hypothetical protein SAMN02799630_04448 [Paenibacillus sp. UNCCL117]|uniref:hypothetical protein n=1 Tax=unclassified Paenibacillus TaxID=185978 RepID=UPI00088C6126|nr:MULTISPECIES: hypothetical protein [unclassified Paenibacillus]SDE02988.1 hypothetical protein SAMN04488602_11757 [Paenibacillus sp. cl123]SFW57319.1 hypothetical protein SAMN02799630_04448 [Paenibacillus sp. UNCCL117]
MEPLLLVVLVVILALSVFRLLRMGRRLRRQDRSADIQEKLARLRKKRDEE